jgi:hypothetical protein
VPNVERSDGLDHGGGRGEHSSKRVAVAFVWSQRSQLSDDADELPSCAGMKKVAKLTRLMGVWSSRDTCVPAVAVWDGVLRALGWYPTPQG